LLDLLFNLVITRRFVDFSMF